VDVCVAGLGAMGSMAAWELARRGARVVAIDPNPPPHALGSSHGGTRMIREAYFEAPFYVPMVRRAYDRWAELERAGGERLLEMTGGLMVGPPDGALVAGARASAEAHGLPYEILDAAEVRARFPAMLAPEGTVGLLEPRLGMLYPERAVAAALRLAREAGAALRLGEALLGWSAAENGLTVRTTGGALRADALVLALGPWAGDLLPPGLVRLEVARQVQAWFAPAEPELLALPRFVPFIWEWAPERYLYGFPDQGAGAKMAIHREGDATTVAAVDRTVRPADVAAIREPLRRVLPAADGEVRAASVCLYTNAPDGHFVIDRLPGDPRVVLASPCSGHGFKFASALGEAIADLATGREPALDLAPFRLERFQVERAEAPRG